MRGARGRREIEEEGEEKAEKVRRKEWGHGGRD